MGRDDGNVRGVIGVAEVVVVVVVRVSMLMLLLGVGRFCCWLGWCEGALCV